MSLSTHPVSIPSAGALSAHNQLILSTHAQLPFIFEFRARKKRAGVKRASSVAESRHLVFGPTSDQNGACYQPTSVWISFSTSVTLQP